MHEFKMGESAVLIGVSPDTVRRLADSGALKTRRTRGGQRLVDATEERVHGEWEYAPGLLRSIRPELRMNLEQAKEFILRYGQCARCGRRLKAAQSVERGIGPVCIQYFSF